LTKINQKGQAVTEAVLILVLLFGFTFAVANYFRNEEVLKKLVKGPFSYMAGMLQNGVWLPADKGAVSHPSGHIRHIVIDGEKAQ
jgi:hypothetical protein